MGGGTSTGTAGTAEGYPGLPSWKQCIADASRDVLAEYTILRRDGFDVGDEEFDMIVTDISAQACHTMIVNLFGQEIADKYVPEAVKP